MKLLILADLHIEFEGFDRTDTEADVVILAGDTDTKLKGIEWAKEAFADRPVIYVPGNHEYYGSCYQEHRRRMREAAVGSNVLLLDRDKCEINGVVFLGATLWTDFLMRGHQYTTMVMCECVISDYREIRTLPNHSLFRPADAARIHAAEKAWLQKELEAVADRGKQTVVVTHHLPSLQSLQSLPEHERKDHVNGAYASDLDELIESHGPALWIHGHKHRAVDYIIGKTRVLSNPQGYPDQSPQQTGFRCDLVVEIEAEPGELRVKRY